MALHKFPNAPDFELWAPFDLVEKSGEEKREDGVIIGIATSEQEDSDGEVVERDGLDWSYFKAHGFLTYEHPLGISNIVGHPTKIEPVEVDDGNGNVFKAVKITAKLLMDDPLGRQIYEKARALKKAGGERRLGFSIEGKVLPGGKKGGRICKAKVISLAISAAPKNHLSWWEPIAASMLQFMSQMQGSMFPAQGGVPTQLLERAEAIGYPSQGEAAQGAGGIEKLAVQSLQGVPDYERYGKGLSNIDMLTSRALKKFPFLSWSQGQGLAKVILSGMSIKES